MEELDSLIGLKMLKALVKEVHALLKFKNAGNKKD